MLLAALFGLSACATFSDDPRARTPGQVIDDEALENLITRQIRNSEANFDGSHLVVVSYNGIVLIAGQVSSLDLKTTAENIARDMAKVRSIHNELEIGGPISYFARTNDGWLTSKVKSRLAASAEVDAGQFKVVTENGTVFLMGLTGREHADAAVGVARSVYGVQKIVKVFEYLD
ncbi:MAG: BON domain-containing protein [Pseudomonadales bacterium]|nr:BON domain-containing protein [Pseudomonadales bacterium]MDP6470869.1 BON domain-containing protein [Pseudomonadales bacterium]MDP6825946.1 BON domain-containing protein [Pseudomonadales bacterium]MDP6972258.1 BON domain-containing protein [Pseudomonadales bacterium]